MLCLRAFPLLFASVLSGCSALSGALGAAFQKPTLTFRDVRLRALSLETAELDLLFTVENPNAVGVDLARVRYALSVEGHPVVSGAPELGLQVPARGSTELSFPAKVVFAEVSKSVAAMLSRETSTYRAEGELDFDTPIGLVALPLSAQGSFKNPRLPTVAVRPPRVEMAGLTRARVTVPLDINNPNAFPVPLDRLTSELRIDGAPLGAARVHEGTLPAEGAKTVELAVDVDLLASGLAVASALKNGQGTLSLDGAVAFGGLVLPLSERIRF